MSQSQHQDIATVTLMVREWPCEERFTDLTWQQHFFLATKKQDECKDGEKNKRWRYLIWTTRSALWQARQHTAENSLLSVRAISRLFQQRLFKSFSICGCSNVVYTSVFYIWKIIGDFETWKGSQHILDICVLPCCDVISSLILYSSDLAVPSHAPAPYRIR